MVIPGIAVVAPLFLSATIVYQGTSDDFPNPERGGQYRTMVWGNGEDLESTLSSWRTSDNVTVNHLAVRLDNFRTTALPASYLDGLRSTFASIRRGGAKSIVRFYYNHDSGGADATLSQCLAHIEQLAPVLEENYDVIAYVEAGFIGAWGEWHSSQNLGSANARSKILLRLLAVLPDERSVVLRYPRHKQEILGVSTALGPADAFDGSNSARTGAHDDCLLCNPCNGGTYSPSCSASDIEMWKNYLNADNRYVPQGGESWYPNNCSYGDCALSLNALARMRWDTYAIADNDCNTLIDTWVAGGCLAEIKRRLGYRLRLIQAAIGDRAAKGGLLTIDLELANDGWGKIYNPRSVAVVLRNREDGTTRALQTSLDPRFWIADSNPIRVSVEVTVPADVASGTYDVLLHLADPDARLRDDPRYAIRLANQDVWEPSTGYNSLQHTLTIGDAEPSCAGTGGSCCAGGEACTGGTAATTTADCALCCVGGSCEGLPLTCGAQSGVCCGATATCTGTVVPATDCGTCCSAGSCGDGDAGGGDADGPPAQVVGQSCGCSAASTDGYFWLVVLAVAAQARVGRASSCIRKNRWGEAAGRHGARERHGERA